MDFDKLIDTVLSEINGQRAWDWVARISQYNRIQGSNGYHDILEVIKTELHAMGYTDIEHFESPADGCTKTWDYVAPYQWELESGKLEVVAPAHVKLCDSEVIPVSVVTHSSACDVIAEVVDIGKGDLEEDYRDDKVKGKIVLMSSITNMYRDLIENSTAIGVIYYPDLKRTGDQTNKHVYNSFFTTKDRLKKAKFGFSITYAQAMQIKEYLKKGPVQVHAKIDAKHIEGNLEVLTTCIQGKEEPEVILIAHLCHPKPGANDNASGAAGLLELARSLKSLIDKRLIELPKYTIRFLWVPEFNGTVPWMNFHEQKVKSSIACLNLDMIGEHRLKIGYPLQINLAPHSTPSILNDLSSFIIKKIADHPNGIAINGTKVPMSFRLTSFEGGSDHVLFADFYFGVASLMFGHNDPYYHSSMDTVEFCDATELKRVIGMASTIAYILSRLDDNIILDLWPIIHQGVFSRWSHVIRVLEIIYLEIQKYDEQKMHNQKELILLGNGLVNAFSEYEEGLINWIKNYSISKEIHAKLDFLNKEISQLINFQKPNWEILVKGYSEAQADDQTQIQYQAKYKPAFEGPISVNTIFQLYRIPIFKEFCEILGYEFMGPVNELINLLCKSYDIFTISSYLSLEYDTIVPPSRLQPLINHLIKIGVVKKLENC